MNNENGWYERCNNFVAQGIAGPDGKTYATQEQCLIQNSDYIDRDVDSLYGFMDSQNNGIKAIQDKYKEDGEFFSNDIINTEEFVNEYSGKVTTNLDNLGSTFEDPRGKGETINLGNIKDVLSVEGFNENKYSI